MNKSIRQGLTFLLGLMVGFAVFGSAGWFFFQSRLEARNPKRYDVQKSSEIMLKARDGVSIYIASSLDRIFQDGNTLLKPDFADIADISLARNEYESFQVVVTAKKRNIRGVSLAISDLTDLKTANRIDKQNISWRIVGYVPTERPYYRVRYVGQWPDPLLPPGATDISENTTQPFWVTVYVPENTPAGKYEGTITILETGKKIDQIPLYVQVHNFSLPRASSLKTAFDFYGHETFKRYPQRERENTVGYQARLAALNDSFITEMLKYRMNPILNLDPANNQELANVDRYCVLGLNNFSVGKRGGTLNNNWPQDEEGIQKLMMLYRTYGEILKLNRLLPYTYIYTWDEGDIGNPQVARICAMIHKAHPGLKNMVCYHGFWDVEKDPDWGKDIDIWCFQIDNFNEQMMRKLQERGKEIWMYVSGPGDTGSPNLALDFDSIDYRIIPWLCWKYDIKGFLYWCVNWWPLADPFKTAKNTTWEQNGNGLLFYPGENGPIASLRLEIFRDGMEDYEYVQLLMKNLMKIKDRKSQEPYKTFFQDSIKLLTVDERIAFSMTDFDKSGEELKARRTAIAEKIEEFERMFPIEVENVVNSGVENAKN